MRHGIAGNKLNRNTTLRKATVRDIAKATLIQQRISTTKAKAKEARKLVDQLITLGKKGTLADKRRAFAVLCDHKLVSELFNKTAPRFKNRVGGYTRIITLGERRGDNAQLAFLELTEKEKVIVSTVKSATSSKVDSKEIPSKPVVESVSDKKEAPSKKDSVKSDSKQESKSDKDKKGRKMLGWVRKMFNRKSSGK